MLFVNNIVIIVKVKVLKKVNCLLVFVLYMISIVPSYVESKHWANLALL